MKKDKEAILKIDSELRRILRFVPIKYHWFDDNSVRIQVRRVSTLRRIEERVNKKQFPYSKVRTIEGAHSFLDLYSEVDSIFITYNT